MPTFNLQKLYLLALSVDILIAKCLHVRCRTRSHHVYTCTSIVRNGRHESYSDPKTNVEIYSGYEISYSTSNSLLFGIHLYKDEIYILEEHAIRRRPDILPFVAPSANCCVPPLLMMKHRSTVWKSGKFCSNSKNAFFD